MLAIDLVFKDGQGELNDCSIYDGNDRGILPIEDCNVAHWLLSNDNKWVHFQNSYVSGQCHSSKIKSFIIKHVEERSCR